MLTTPCVADTLRIGLWHAPLARNGPGVLLRDVQREDEDLAPILTALRAAKPDILVLTRFDYDVEGKAIRALARALDQEAFDAMPLATNLGVPTGVDLDGNGTTAEPRDAQGYGRFPGQGAMALLSRFPIDRAGARHFNDLLWQDLPDNLMQATDTGRDVQRLSGAGHWIVPVQVSKDQTLTLLIGHLNTPVFDGPEDRNGRRNRDELRLWEQVLDGMHGPPPTGPLIFAVNTNLDPANGQGDRRAMAGFLARPIWQDPLVGQPTVTWRSTGPMRVSYLLPDRSLQVTQSQVHPPVEGARHHLITLDITLETHGSP